MSLPSYFSIILLVVIITLLLLYVYKGIRNGLILELLITIQLFLCAIIAYFLTKVTYGKVTILKGSNFNTSSAYLNSILADYISALILFLLFFLVAYILLRIFRSKLRFINNINLIGFISKIGGALLGGVKACIYIVLIIIFVASPVFTNGNQTIYNAHLNPLKDIIEEKVPFAGNVLRGFNAIEEVRNKDNASVEDIQYIIEEFK